MEKEVISKIKNLKNIKPSKEWVDSNRNILLTQIKGQVVKKDLDSGIFLEFFKSVFGQKKFVFATAKYLLVLLMIFGVSLGGGIASVGASRGSVPGDLLYPIKITIEKAQLTLSSKKEDKVKLELEFAGRRIEEVDKIIETPEREKEKKMEKALSNFKNNLNTVNQHLDNIKNEGKSTEVVELAVMIDNRVEEFSEVLTKKKDIIPEAVKAVKEALNVSEETSEKVVDVIIEEHQKDESKILSNEDVAKRVEEKISKAEEQLNELEEKFKKLNKTEEESESKIENDSEESSESEESNKGDEVSNEEKTDDSDTDDFDSAEKTVESEEGEDNEDNNEDNNIEQESESAKVVLGEARKLLEEGDFAGAFLKVKESNDINKNLIEVVEAAAITDVEDAESNMIQAVSPSENEEDESQESAQEEDIVKADENQEQENEDKTDGDAEDSEN